MMHSRSYTKLMFVPLASGGEFDELFPVHSINIIAHKIYPLFKAAPYHNAIVFDFDAANYFGILSLEYP